MKEPDADTLMQHVLALVYAALRADEHQNRADGMATGLEHAAAVPQRFSSQAGVEQARISVVAACMAADADESLQHFLSTHWLERFAPVPM